MSLMKSIQFAGWAIVGIVLTACSVQPPQQKTSTVRLPDPGPDNIYTVEWPDLGKGEDRFIRMTIDHDIAEHCKFTAPHFQLNARETRGQDYIELQRVAECLKQPPFDTVDVKLIGRADARGSKDYNLQLGQRRAERIKQILVHEGILANRITAVSRGEANAVGDDGLYSYGYDRRVDIVILGLVHALH